MTLPAVSVVVPCRNEAGRIEECVTSLLAQKPVPGDFEVIVVDGMSDDGTRDILDRLVGTDSRLHVVDNPARITPCAMNAGIRRARGRYIAIAGAHSRYATDYLAQALDVIETRGVDNVGGSVIFEAANGPLQQAIAAAHHSPFSTGGARWHNPDYVGPAATVFGGFYKREVFDRIGLFDEELVRNQDDELNLRLTRSGGSIWHSPRIKSWYSPRASLKNLFLQQMQFGYWRVRVTQKHRLPASLRQWVPGIFLMALLLLPLMAVFWRPVLWLWLGLVALYGTCSVAASLLARTTGHVQTRLLLPPAFACYHIGYGYGLLLGVKDFILLARGPASNQSRLTRVPTPPSAAK